MEANGKGITESELANLPEVENVVLWQDDDGPTTVTDSQGIGWFIGIYDGKFCKRRSI
jgi:hypothetical protein